MIKLKELLFNAKFLLTTCGVLFLIALINSVSVDAKSTADLSIYGKAAVILFCLVFVWFFIAYFVLPLLRKLFSK